MIEKEAAPDEAESARQKGEAEFRNVLALHNKQDVHNFFDFLDKIVRRFDLHAGDSRIVTTTSSNRLNFIIGQRYGWNLYANTKRGKFHLITNSETENTTAVFEGTGEQPYYNSFDDYEFALRNMENAFAAIDRELKRTQKSGFRKHDNEVFRRAIFDRSYRTNLLDQTQFSSHVLSFANLEPEPIPLNEILYGPPGTGKTYTLQKEYFPRFTVSEASLSRKQFLENTLADKTWWQVLSMAVLDLGETKVERILEHELVQTKIALSSSAAARATLWGRLQAHTVEECPNVNVAGRSEPRLFYKNEASEWRVEPDRLKEFYPEAFEILEKTKSYKAQPHKQIKNYEFITFHQAFSYEDFIEGIKPRMEEEDGDSIAYEIKDGIFKKIALRAQADPDNHYALFIDEINRGNVSAIFGELITLIEEDKRSGGTNRLSVKLPYSKKDFEVPSNLHIIGTMNTADRSVEALDTALRRRFSFREILPQPHLLANISFGKFTLQELLQAINERIEFLFDRDHTIGHSYFMNLESDDWDGLESVFKNKIIPLLQEYFYKDYEKIALVLGPGFVNVKHNHEVRFPSLSGIARPDAIAICELHTEIEDIEQAVNLLLNVNEQE